MATQLTASSPLMQPVSYNGQTYYTSQYFHQQYLANSPHGGKYREHSAFLKALRSIEAYPLYLEQGDIVERAYPQGKSLNPIWIQLYKSTGYQPLTLLNATAQVALSHHLDDAISQQISVAANTMVAKQAARRTTEILPGERAERELAAFLGAGKLLGAPLYLVQQEAVKAVLVATGVDFRPLLKGAPAQDQISAADIMLEPTELAKELGLSNGRAMNLALEALGFQVKAIGGGWGPTPAGAPLCAVHAWASDHGTKTGVNLKWRASAVREALATQQQAGGMP